MANEIELPFGNAFFPCQNAFEKCTTKTKLCNRESYIKKLYTRFAAGNARTCSRIVTRSTTVSFSIKITLCETNNIAFSKNYSKLGKTNARS